MKGMIVNTIGAVSVTLFTVLILSAAQSNNDMLGIASALFLISAAICFKGIKE